MTLDGSIQRSTAAGTYTKSSGIRRSYAVLFCNPSILRLCFCASEFVDGRVSVYSTVQFVTDRYDKYMRVCRQLRLLLLPAKPEPPIIGTGA